MVNSTTHAHRAAKEIEDRPGSVRPNSEITQWCITICIIVVGLFALFFFAHMGGMSALVGPWIILAVSLLVQKTVKVKWR
jgi:hypothetical protein